MTDDERRGGGICNKQLDKDSNTLLFNRAVQVGEIRTQISVGTRVWTTPRQFTK